MRYGWLILMSIVIIPGCVKKLDKDSEKEWKEVYTVIVSNLFVPQKKSDDKHDVIIRDRTLKFSLPVEELATKMPSLDEEIIKEYSKNDSSTFLVPDPCTPGTNCKLDEVKEIKRPSDNREISVDWQSLFKRYPSQAIIMSFSKIVFNNDGNQALTAVNAVILLGFSTQQFDEYMLLEKQNNEWLIIKRQKINISGADWGYVD